MPASVAQVTDTVRPDRNGLSEHFMQNCYLKCGKKNQRFFNHFFQGHIEKCPRRTNFPGNICVLRQHFENARETVIREKMRNHR